MPSSKPKKNKPLNILLADDDKSDRYFFEKALKTLDFTTILATAEDGEKLMTYLGENADKLPDVLFLDLNMPRKNGSECLAEIKQDPKLKGLPVIIYSTSLNEDVADRLYKEGAHYYVVKQDFAELQQILRLALGLMTGKKFERPSREGFVNTLVAKPAA